MLKLRIRMGRVAEQFYRQVEAQWQDIMGSARTVFNYENQFTLSVITGITRDDHQLYDLYEALTPEGELWLRVNAPPDAVFIEE